MKHYCLTLDLKNDPELIAEYEEMHKAVWPEIIASIKNSGIRQMEIYRLHNRLFMAMETEDDFSFEQKSKEDNQKCEGAGLGEFNVEVPAGRFRFIAWRKVAIDEPYL